MQHDRKISELGRLLFEQWDPIGVNSNPNLADEYEYLVPDLVVFLRSKPTESKLVEWLQVAEKDVHCETHGDVRSRVARLLLAAQSP